MTIEPAAVRFNFGTSVRTWAQDAPPQPIIAKLFRDVGDSDEGLTPAVEEIGGALMARRARDEAFATQIRDKCTTSNKGGRPPGSPNVHVKLSDIHRDILETLETQGPTRTREIGAMMTVECKRLVKSCNRLADRGCVTAVAVDRRGTLLWRITEAGIGALKAGMLPPVEKDARK